MVAVFASFGIFLGVLNWFPWFQFRLWFGAAIGLHRNGPPAILTAQHLEAGPDNRR
jgi:hypothetical protein